MLFFKLLIHLIIIIELYWSVSGAPHNVNYTSIKASLVAIPGVLAVHSLHMWTLTMNKNAATVHLVIGEIDCSINKIYYCIMFINTCLYQNEMFIFRRQ